MAVEVKQGISQLELLYEQITKEELAKQQRKEHKKQKRRKKKEKRAEQEEKENNCEVCFIYQGNLCVVSIILV
jgi:mannosyltransferase OCH1-like enzyme